MGIILIGLYNILLYELCTGGGYHTFTNDANKFHQMDARKEDCFVSNPIFAY